MQRNMVSICLVGRWFIVKLWERTQIGEYVYVLRLTQKSGLIEQRNGVVFQLPCPDDCYTQHMQMLVLTWHSSEVSCTMSLYKEIYTYINDWKQKSSIDIVVERDEAISYRIMSYIRNHEREKLIHFLSHNYNICAWPLCMVCKYNDLYGIVLHMSTFVTYSLK